MLTRTLAVAAVLMLLPACGPRPIIRPNDSAPTVDRVTANVAALRELIAGADLPTLTAGATPRLDAIEADALALGADVVKWRTAFEAQGKELALANDAGTTKVRSVLYAIMGIGLVLFALGTAGLFFIPVASMKWIGGMASVTGGVLAVTCLIFGSAITSLANAMPWLVNTVIGVLCLMVVAGGAVLLWRLRKYERDTGEKAQDKLIERGDIGGAAALAYAQAGGGNAGWKEAKLIEVAAAINPSTPEPGSGK